MILAFSYAGLPSDKLLLPSRTPHTAKAEKESPGPYKCSHLESMVRIHPQLSEKIPSDKLACQLQSVTIGGYGLSAPE
jgi:hypothetical protein